MGEWSYECSILDLDTRWKRVISFTPQPLYPQIRTPSMLCIRGQVTPRASLDAVKKREMSCTCQQTNSGHPARSQSLYRLSYPGSHDNEWWIQGGGNSIGLFCCSVLVISMNECEKSRKSSVRISRPLANIRLWNMNTRPLDVLNLYGSCKQEETLKWCVCRLGEEGFGRSELLHRRATLIIFKLVSSKNWSVVFIATRQTACSSGGCFQYRL
jgi:hypothetical protein